MFGPNGFVNFNDVKFHLIQDIQHVILKIRIRFVDFIDQQNRTGIGLKGLADFAHLDIILNIADIPIGVAETAVIEARQGVILVQGFHQFHAGFDIENDQRHLKHLCNGMGQHGLAGPRLSF